MIDVHAHFAEEGYGFPAEWEKIKAAGVQTVILAADTLEHAAWHAKFCKEHEGAFFTVGVHPEFASSFAFNGTPPTLPSTLKEGGGKKKCPLPAFPRVILNECEGSRGTESERHLRDSSALPQNDAASGVVEGFRSRFLSLAADKKCVAVGEIGLDYHYPDPDKAAQRAAFEAQLEIAEELGLPVQIHSRDACADTLAILRAYHGRRKHGFLMHCYSYGAENLNDFLELGAYFSFGGVTCFKNARRVVEAVAACPMERILSETDSPYLSPFRGEKNTPANIPVIVEKLAEIKGVSLDEMIGTIRRSAARLFPRIQ